MTFTRFWGAGLFLLLTFYSDKFMGDLRSLRDFLFFALSMFSVIWFGVERKRLLAPLVFILFFSAYSYNSVGFLYQFPMVCAGLLVLSQFLSLEVDLKEVVCFILIYAIICVIWGAFNYFGVEPAFGFYIKPRVISFYQIQLEYNGILYPISPFYSGANFIWYYPEVKMSGPLLNHTLSSQVVALALVLCPFRLMKYFAIPFLAGLYFYDSSLSIIGATLGLTYRFMVYKNLKANRFIFIAVLALVGIYVFGNLQWISGQERNQVWLNTIQWVNGSVNGLGYFHDQYFQHFKHTQIFLQEHNEFLSLYVSLGIAGLLIASCVLLYSLNKESYFRPALVTFIFLCTGNFPLHISALAVLGIIIFSANLKGDQYGFFSNTSKSSP